MKWLSTFEKLAAVLRHDLLTAMRYRSALDSGANDDSRDRWILLPGQYGGAHPELAPSLGTLTASCAFLLPLSLLFFSYAVRRARLEGTLSLY